MRSNTFKGYAAKRLERVALQRDINENTTVSCTLLYVVYGSVCTIYTLHQGKSIRSTSRLYKKKHHYRFCTNAVTKKFRSHHYFNFNLSSRKHYTAVHNSLKYLNLFLTFLYIQEL